MNDAIYSKYAKFIINEIKPRAKKINGDLDTFLPSKFAFYILSLEHKGLFTRYETRQFLDYLVKLRTEPDPYPNEQVLRVLKIVLTSES